MSGSAANILGANGEDLTEVLRRTEFFPSAATKTK